MPYGLDPDPRMHPKGLRHDSARYNTSMLGAHTTSPRILVVFPKHLPREGVTSPQPEFVLVKLLVYPSSSHPRDGTRGTPSSLADAGPSRRKLIAPGAG